MGLKNFARKFGFTENELKTILFLLAAALVGLALKFFDYSNVEPIKYDYTKQDSLFNAYKSSPAESGTGNTVRKKFASRKETFDFSKNKSNLNIKFVNRQNSINVNKATKEQLVALPGIGSKTAEKIIAYRNKHGKFRRKEDLMNVKGIGKKKFEKIKIFIEVN